MTITSNAPEAQERVLSTLNRDGSRRWIRPKLSKGRFQEFPFQLIQGHREERRI